MGSQHCLMYSWYKHSTSMLYKIARSFVYSIELFGLLLQYMLYFVHSIHIRYYIFDNISLMHIGSNLLLNILLCRYHYLGCIHFDMRNSNYFVRSNCNLRLSSLHLFRGGHMLHLQVHSL